LGNRQSLFIISRKQIKNFMDSIIIQWEKNRGIGHAERVFA